MRRTNIYVWTSVALALSVAVPAQAWPLVVPARDSLLVRVALPPLPGLAPLPVAASYSLVTGQPIRMGYGLPLPPITA